MSKNFVRSYFPQTARLFSSRAVLVLFAQIVFAVLLQFLAIAPARAQQAQMDDLAGKMADAISQSKQKSVVVLDFGGPGGKPNALDRSIADQFSAALAKSARKFKVVDRSLVRDEIDRVDLTDPQMSFWLAQGLDANALVFGKLALDGDELTISIDAHTADDEKQIGEFETKVPFTDEMKGLSSRMIESDDASRYPAAGQNGYTLASCIYCPAARYSDQAARAKAEGAVVLRVVVGLDGQAHDVKVARSLPNGLTGMAVKTILSWKFKPATGPDGKPVATQVPIEVQFYLGP